MYAKNLKLHKGVENRIQFQFLNQEQKPVDITGKTFTFRLISYDGTQVLLQVPLVTTLALTGIAELRTKAGQLEGIDPQNATYSLEVIDPDGDASEYTGHPHYPVFTNSDAGGRGLCQVVSSIMPDFVSATNVTIPSHSIPSSNTVTYTSSVLTSKDSGVTTIQAFYDNYSGTATIQGSTLNDTDWYDINTSTYLETTASDGYTVTGFHPYLRLSFTSTQGNVTQILAR